MNWIRKTIIFIGLLIAVLFAFNANEVPAQTIKIEKSNSSFSANSIQSLDFIQPQVSNTFNSYHNL